VRGEAFQQQVALALPEGMAPERFVRVMITALNDNPDLASKADMNTVFQAGLKAAADGLLPDGEEAAFVIFKGEAVYMPMIGGFRKIAGEQGWSIRTTAVHENDEFAYELGEEPRIIHRPALRDRGDVVAAYAVAVHRDGRRELEVMNREEIDAVRAVSRSKDNGPWVGWYSRMAEKTVGRRLFKKLPLGEIGRSVDAARQEVERRAEASPGEAASLMYGPQGETFTARELGAGSGPTPPEPAAQESTRSTAEPASAPAEASPPAPAPSPSPEPEEFADTEPPPAATTSQEEILEQAGAIKFSSGRHKGKTIAAILEEGDLDWLVWAMGGGWKTEPQKGAITTYVLAKVSAEEIETARTRIREGRSA